MGISLTAYFSLPSFLGSSLLKNGISLSEAEFLCLSSEKAAHLWATCHPVGKKNNSRVCQKYLQCHREVDKGVHPADKEGCGEVVAPTDKGAGIQDLRRRRECAGRADRQLLPLLVLAVEGGRVCCGLQLRE